MTLLSLPLFCRAFSCPECNGRSGPVSLRRVCRAGRTFAKVSLKEDFSLLDQTEIDFFPRSVGNDDFVPHRRAVGWLVISFAPPVLVS